jgi:hypothetical protein
LDETKVSKFLLWRWRWRGLKVKRNGLNYLWERGDLRKRRREQRSEKEGVLT